MARERLSADLELFAQWSKGEGTIVITREHYRDLLEATEVGDALLLECRRAIRDGWESKSALLARVDAFLEGSRAIAAERRKP